VVHALRCLLREALPDSFFEHYTIEAFGEPLSSVKGGMLLKLFGPWIEIDYQLCPKETTRCDFYIALLLAGHVDTRSTRVNYLGPNKTSSISPGVKGFYETITDYNKALFKSNSAAEYRGNRYAGWGKVLPDTGLAPPAMVLAVLEDKVWITDPTFFFLA
jgi:hypothetical protein